MPLVDLMKLFNPYLPTNGSAFYLCPADKPPGWNYAWTKSLPGGFGFNLTTNDLLFGSSYYYYQTFFYDDNFANLQRRSTDQVRSPAKKAIMTCYAKSVNGLIGDKNLAHGKDGFPLLFVDSHAAYTKHTSLNQPTPFWDYNADWTVGGLTGEDLK